ncbi:hypothetical protein [Marinobacter sp. GH_1]|uniref:hypothetical protein n=1 Tax=Marinobacter sp. GH_1 TaxID=3402164 RepID=UPI003B431C1B
MSNKLKRKQKKQKKTNQPEDKNLEKHNRVLANKAFEEKQKQRFNQIAMRRFQ